MSDLFLYHNSQVLCPKPSIDAAGEISQLTSPTVPIGTFVAQSSLKSTHHFRPLFQQHKDHVQQEYGECL